MTGAPNPTRRRSYLALAKEADAILKRANCDTTTGGKQDRQYRRNKRAESKRLARILDLATTGGICNGTLNEEGPARHHSRRAHSDSKRHHHHHEATTDAQYAQANICVKPTA